MFKPALLMLGLLAACNSTSADEADVSASVADDALPEVRYYMVADT